ncbi:MAG TPA: SLC13 family permease [Pseudonocardia sp.]|uniref:SLC13 family permease n=1 Tax=Pseudonocardia sp. TaxID=60912 RepID=UPI002B4B3833|nr:SLC13 family permease [Pseudonocardia sp.]HLU56719.1 SLC13 family permease [Pseudonocardia sp.]
MGPQILSIVALVAMFVLATTLDINLGVLGFIAAFTVGTWVLGLDTEAILAGFPGGLFVLLVGLTYLFALAAANGTVDLIVHWAICLVRGRAALVPWVLFGLAALLCAMGAVYAVAIVAPLAMPLARRYRIDPLLAGAMVVHGALAGFFSPVNPIGGFLAGLFAREGLAFEPLALLLTSFGINLAIAALLFALLGRRWTEPPDPDEPGPGGGEASVAVRTSHAARVRPDQAVTLIGVGVLGLGTVALGIDVGFLAMCVAGVVTLACRGGHREAVGAISWSTVLLVCGVITYLGVVQEAGTIDLLGGRIAGIGAPLVAALLLCYLGGVASAFASSIAILGVVVPLAVPFLQQGDVAVVGMAAALAVSATVVDVSPFSTYGALVLASTAPEQRPALYRRLLRYSVLLIAVGPLLAWATLVVPGWGR